MKMIYMHIKKKKKDINDQLLMSKSNQKSLFRGFIKNLTIFL